MIHAYHMGDLNIVCDIESGAVHVLDNPSYELVNLIIPPLHKQCPEQILAAMSAKGYDSDYIIDTYTELYKLYEDGLLFSDAVPVNPERYSQTDAPIKALCLHVSHDCDLRCKYCFASTGNFGMKRKLMDAKTGKKAIDYVIAHSGSRKHIEIDFFGGEPLMAFDTVKEVVDYATSIADKHNKEFRFTITTNGMLLDDNITKYINEHMSNVVLSIDGRKCINDKMRARADGTGSYDKIVPKFQKLVGERGDKDYYARGTYTRENLDFTNDVLHMAELGFKQISVEPVVSDPKEPYSIREEDISAIEAEYEKLTAVMLNDKDHSFNFFHFNVDLEQGPCVIKRLRGCGAGSEYVAVTPDGDIYPCHQFVGEDAFKLGNIFDDSFDKDISAKFAAQNVYTRKGCSDCWAKYYCSGGCSASNYYSNGDLSIPYDIGCRLERKRLECAIFMKAQKTCGNVVETV